MKRIFGRGRYANVTSTLALVAVLGGTAYAANTVRSSDIVNGQVKSPDIGSKQVKSSDLGDNSVTTAKVRNGSLQRADFAAGQLPAGPQGPQGAKGDPGAPGAPGAAGAPGTARAYAQVNTTPALVAARTKGFTTVTRPGTGVYCVTAPGIDPATSAAVVSPEWGASAGADLGASVYANAPSCPAGAFQVMTINAGGLSNSTAFYIVVP